MNFVNWALSWFRYDESLIAALTNRVTLLEKEFKTMSAAFDAVRANLTAFETEVATDVAALQASIKSLQDQIASGSTDQAGLTAMAAEIAQQTADLHAKVAPPTP